jgi:hypothetical protein
MISSTLWSPSARSIASFSPRSRVLYAEIGRCLGSARATATMSADHEEVMRLAKELGEPAGGDPDHRPHQRSDHGAAITGIWEART